MFKPREGEGTYTDHLLVAAQTGHGKIHHDVMSIVKRYVIARFLHDYEWDFGSLIQLAR